MVAHNADPPVISQSRLRMSSRILIVFASLLVVLVSGVSYFVHTKTHRMPQRFVVRGPGTTLGLISYPARVNLISSAESRIVVRDVVLLEEGILEVTAAEAEILERAQKKGLLLWSLCSRDETMSFRDKALKLVWPEPAVNGPEILEAPESDD
jgi:hypothetical protein